jgi:hypothetical protein
LKARLVILRQASTDKKEEVMINVESTTGSLRRSDLLLKEYEALREEIRQTMQTRAQILALGFAAVAALVGAAGLSYLDEKPGAIRATIVLFCGAIPGLSLITLVLWLGEFARMTRAGAHVAWLESRLDRLVGKSNDHYPPLTWELHLWLSPHPSFLRSPFRRKADAHQEGADPSTALYIDAHRFVQLAFVLIGVLSSMMGLLISKPPRLNYSWIPLMWLLFGTWVVVRFETHYSSMKDYIQSLLSKPPVVMDCVYDAVWQGEGHDTSRKQLEPENVRPRRILAKKEVEQ